MLDPFDTRSPPELRVPEITDHAILADVGRMNVRLRWAARPISYDLTLNRGAGESAKR